MKKIFFTSIITLLLVFFTSINSYGQCGLLDVDLIIDEISDLQDSLVTNFPNICKKVVIGTSVSGYDLVALKFSDNVNTDESEPEILLTACIHGDEMNPEQVMMKLARRLCVDYSSDAATANLINTREIWIIAVMNPDGLRGINFWNRPNANGVDLNRNYGYMWNKEDFDPYEYSEPETKAVRNFILSRNFNVMIDYHSGLQGIIYPWYYKTDHAPDHPEILHLANNYDTQSGYPVGEFAVSSGADLYVTNGSLVEFAYGSLGIQAFSVELMEFNNPQFNSCQLFTMNKPAIFGMCQKAGEGITGIVTDQVTGQPIKAKISIQGRLPSYSSRVNGDYHRFFINGTYTVTASANGYSTETATVIVTNGGVTQHDFQLTPNNNNSAQIILTCRNYNNTNDPAETWNTLGMNDGNYYAIGDTGYVVLDMGFSVLDISGDDITIHGDASGNGNEYELFHSNSIDGPWVSLGTGSTTTSYDLAGVNNARYFRVEDNGVGAGNVLGAGFHLDAITAGELNVGIGNAIVSNDISVYPNPTINVINFEGDDIQKMKTVSLFDISGKLLLQQNFTNKLDISSFHTGIYFVQLNSENSIVTFKIIKND